MKLLHAIESYIAYKRSLGMRFRSQAAVLRAYCRAVGNVTVEKVRPDSVLAFITGDGQVTARWIESHRVLAGFYRYAIGRSLVTVAPLPADIPKSPPHVAPYIYTVDELKRLVAVTDTLRTPLSPLLAPTMQTLLLLLYGTGMRIGEALSLTLQDVDLENCVLTIRDTKFFKTRLVPIGPRLTMVLRDYLSLRYRLPLPEGAGSAFLAARSGIRMDYRRVNKLFCRLRRHAGVKREYTARYQPRIHDIRHTAAVHRVIAWYRAGMDVQRLLPQLATYLGHVEIDGTQRYLSMTPELLHEASLRFELYARQEAHDA
jgi:integrase/recombinase XerD